MLSTVLGQMTPAYGALGSPGLLVGDRVGQHVAQAVRLGSGQHHPGNLPGGRPAAQRAVLRDRGAAAELISSDPVTGAGVAFVRLESDPDPVRVRAAWVADHDIRAMAGLCAVPEAEEVAA